jgi:hypothetical protein
VFEVKKIVFFALTVIVLIALLSSCNLQTVRVTGTPKIEAPLGATSIVLNDFLGDFEDQLEGSLSGLTKVKDKPLTFRFATDLVNISMSDFFSADQIDFSDFQESVSIGFDIPELPSLDSQNISLPTIDPDNSNVDYAVSDLILPSGVDVSGSFPLPNVPIPNTTDSTTIENLDYKKTVNTSGFNSITFSNGSFNIRVGLSSSLSTIEAKIKVLNSSENLVAESSFVDISDGINHDLSVDLTSKTLTSTFYIQPVFRVNNNSGSTTRDINIEILGITGGKISAASGVEFEETFNNSNTINLSLDADAFATATLNGSIEFSLTQPSGWQNISVVTDVEIGQGGKVLKSQTMNAYPDSIDLTGIDIGTNNIDITVNSTVTGASNSEFTTGTVSFGVTPNISVSSVKDAKVNLSTSATKPADLNRVDFASGKMIISATGVDFKEIDGSVDFGTNVYPLTINADNNIELDLSGKTLDGDIYVTINTVSLDMPSNSSFDVNVNISNPSFGYIEYSKIGLEQNINQNIEIPETIGNLVKQVDLNDGEIFIEWNNGLPLTIKSFIKSDMLVINENIDFTEGASSKTIDLSTKVLDFNTYNAIDITAEASPAGYDGSLLTLTPTSPIAPGDSLTFDATFTVRDLGIGEITIGATTISDDLSEAPIDLSSSDLDFLKNIEIVTIPATINFNLENVSLDASLTVLATYTYDDNGTVTTDTKEIMGNIEDGYVATDFATIINRKPSNMSFGYKIETKEAVLNTTGAKVGMSFELDFPMKFDVTQDATFIDNITTEGDLLGRNDDNREMINDLLDQIKTLDLNLDLDNTTGLEVGIKLYNGSELIDTITLLDPSISLNDLISEIRNNEPFTLTIEPFIPAGDYALDANGEIAISFWASLDTELDIPINLNGGDE